MGDLVAEVGKVLGDVPDALQEVACKLHQNVAASLYVEEDEDERQTGVYIFLFYMSDLMMSLFHLHLF